MKHTDNTAAVNELGQWIEAAGEAMETLQAFKEQLETLQAQIATAGPGVIDGDAYRALVGRLEDDGLEYWHKSDTDISQLYDLLVSGDFEPLG